MPGSPVSTPSVADKRLYNGGSEWQNDFSNPPDLQQTFFRNYDAAIGRFIGVDPMPESSESMTVYQYGGNNPIMMNDPMGDKIKLDLPNPDIYREGGSNIGQGFNGPFDGTLGGGPSGGGSFYNNGRAQQWNPLGDLAMFVQNAFSNAARFARSDLSNATSAVKFNVTIDRFLFLPKL